LSSGMWRSALGMMGPELRLPCEILPSPEPSPERMPDGRRSRPIRFRYSSC
jgi:hypothetical protein